MNKRNSLLRLVALTGMGIGVLFAISAFGKRGQDSKERGAYFVSASSPVGMKSVYP